MNWEQPKQNWSKLPHQFFDDVMPNVTSLGELKVILYILRHTWGYQDEYKTISLNDFVNGRKKSDGSQIDNGVGMTKKSVIDGLRRAVEHGFITLDRDDSDKARVKSTYSLGGCKSYTPEVEKLHPGGSEVTPRTKKETKERKTTLSPLPDDDAPQQNDTPQAEPDEPIKLSREVQNEWLEIVREIGNYHSDNYAMLHDPVSLFIGRKAKKKAYRDYTLTEPLTLDEGRELLAYYRNRKKPDGLVFRTPQALNELASEYRAKKQIKRDDPLSEYTLLERTQIRQAREALEQQLKGLTG